MDKTNKRIYKKPVIKSEKIIETSALACVKCINTSNPTKVKCKTTKTS